MARIQRHDVRGDVGVEDWEAKGPGETLCRGPLGRSEVGGAML